jgi:hypothetical protein
MEEDTENLNGDLEDAVEDFNEEDSFKEVEDSAEDLATVKAPIYNIEINVDYIGYVLKNVGRVNVTVCQAECEKLP